MLLTPKNPKIEHCISFTHRRRFFPVSLFIWLYNKHQGCDFDERPVVSTGPSQSPWSSSIHYKTMIFHLCRLSLLICKRLTLLEQSGQSETIRESNQASGVQMYVRRIARSTMYETWRSILLAGTGLNKISSVACGFSSIKIHFRARI